MMWPLIIIVIVLIFLIPTAYAGVIGAPYAPTRLPVIKKALQVLDIGEGDVLIDLGSGDGKVLLAAARKGAQAIGYELSPIMWLISWFRTRREPRAKVRYGNFYKQSFHDATVIFAFLMPEKMTRLAQLLKQQDIPRAEYLLSYVFPLKDIPPITIIREDKCGPIYVYDLAELTQSAADGTPKDT